MAISLSRICLSCFFRILRKPDTGKAVARVAAGGSGKEVGAGAGVRGRERGWGGKAAAIGRELLTT